MNKYDVLFYPHAGTPALIRNRFGRGEAYYFGGAFAEDTVRVFLEKLGVAEPLGDIISLPEGCELALRETGRQTLEKYGVRVYRIGGLSGV